MSESLRRILIEQVFSKKILVSLCNGVMCETFQPSGHVRSFEKRVIFFRGDLNQGHDVHPHEYRLRAPEKCYTVYKRPVSITIVEEGRLS